MYAATWGCALDGILPQLVKVEVDIGRGLPAFEIVGQPGRIIRESRDRIRSAFRNSHFQFPPARITVNLAPADFPKSGSSLDLPISLGVLAASGQLPVQSLEGKLFWGELSLDGRLGSSRGIMPAALLAKEKSLRFIIPNQEIALIQPVEGLSFAAFKDLVSLVSALRIDSLDWEISSANLKLSQSLQDPWLLLGISGGLIARRCLKIAAAGRHNLALIGPPGVGKTLLAQALGYLLPSLQKPEIMEVAQIYSAVGLEVQAILQGRPPVRSPHHTLTKAGLLGGGVPPKPGEITLAHKGLLFLDELPEFSRSVLAAMREPLENGQVSLTRANRCYIYPADFQLVTALNPCPCGYHGFQPEKCRCTERDISSYLRPVTGALADRIHLRLSISRPLWEERSSKSESDFRVTVEAAREEISARSSEEILSRLQFGAKSFLHTLIEKEQGSARAFFQLVSVASTIAALEGSDQIKQDHLAEAWQYRWKADHLLAGGGADLGC